MMRGVAACADHADARLDLAIVVEEVDHACRLERHEVVLEIAAAVPLVRMQRIVPLAAANHVAGAAEPRPKAAGSAHHRAAEVIEVEMRWQHDVDRVRRDAGLCERVIETARAVDAEDVGQLRIQLVRRCHSR